MMQTLKPRLKEVDTSRGLKTVDSLKKPWLKLEDIRTARWVKAKNGRLLPLNHAAWKKLRRSILDAEPLCRMCTAQGLTVAATDVDHIDNNPANNELVNLAPLCHMHHGLKTARDMGHNVRMGCASDGTPLDQGHHWNNATKGPVLRPVLRPLLEPLLKSPATDGHIPSSESSFIANSESVV